MGVHDLSAYFDIKRMLDIPGDEPIFILRAQDKESIGTLTHYAMRVEAAGATLLFCEDVEHVIVDFQNWQDTHREKVKVPD